MKKKIHPQRNFFKIKCSTCGTEYEIFSTKKEIKTDTCSHCHPFYIGEKKYERVFGRVEQFNKKYQK
ncbi:50S ribosomal protein L31 [symbiont of Argiope bruennichi]|uniref:50S ribosomal protein L31 n=1 Tax=symbiont of Argiope bruennichi TaxID=2810479 RepID=UPI003DA46A32